MNGYLRVDSTDRESSGRLSTTTRTEVGADSISSQQHIARDIPPTVQAVEHYKGVSQPRMPSALDNIHNLVDYVEAMSRAKD